MRTDLFVAALRALADAVEAQPPEAPATPAPELKQPPTEAAKPRGRGRPPKGEGVVSAAPEPAPAEVVDPFAPSTVTLEQVRAALTALKAATTQENALAVLKTAGGADNLSALTSDKYAAVVAAVKFRFQQPESVIAADVDDPFETPKADVVMQETTAAPSLEDVKAAVVAAQKITSTDTVQKVVMTNGGTAPTSSGAPGPSLKALAPSVYAKVIAEVKALPKTK